MYQHEATADPAAMVDHLEEMRRAFVIRSEAQQLAASQASHRNTWLTTASTVLATAGGTSAFASLATSDDALLVAIAASLSVTAAVLNELANRLDYSNRVADHRKWAATAGAQARRISFAQGNPVGPDVASRRYHDFLRELQSFDTDARPVHHDLWEQAKQFVESHRTTGPAPRLTSDRLRGRLQVIRSAIPAAIVAGVLIGWRALRRPS